MRRVQGTLDVHLITPTPHCVRGSSILTMSDGSLVAYFPPLVTGVPRLSARDPHPYFFALPT
jgi:hypothetical protein